LKMSELIQCPSCNPDLKEEIYRKCQAIQEKQEYPAVGIHCYFCEGCLMHVLYRMAGEIIMLKCKCEAEWELNPELTLMRR